MNDLFVKLTPLISAVIGGALMHLFSRNKYWAEVNKAKSEKKKLDIECMDSTFDLWRGIVDELRKDVVGLTTEVTALRQQNKMLTGEVEGLRGENVKLKMEMKKFEALLKNNNANHE
jgi:hypothetical protein